MASIEEPNISEKTMRMAPLLLSHAVLHTLGFESGSRKSFSDGWLSLLFWGDIFNLGG